MNVGSERANAILKSINKTDVDLAQHVSSLGSAHSMFFTPTDYSEISNIISSLKTQSAPGWDGVSAKIIKSYKHILVEPITFLCNLSLSTGIFPDLLKKTIVIPIHKVGDTTQPSNYRPIALLSTLSKILEKVVSKRLIRHLELNNLLSQNQFGFRSGLSTEDATLKLTGLVTSHLDAGYKCLGVFLDLQKAFDTVSMPILLARLENAGLRGLVLDWFRSFLSGREQRIKVENHISNSGNTSYGVPQGSTIAPILFLVYINQLCNMTIPGANLIMFADDTVLLFHAKTWELLKKITEDGLAMATSWFEDNLLSLNATKSKVVCFSKTKASSPDRNFKIIMHNFPCNRLSSNYLSNCSCQDMIRVTHIKYLGIEIDENLKWDKHASFITSRIRRLIYVFKTLRTIANNKTIMQIYKALCESILSFSICTWGGLAKTHMIEIERAQRALLKVALKLDFRHHTSDLYVKANVLSVRKLYHISNSAQVP